MGISLRHAIKINASPDRVFQALTDTSEMAAWHHGTVSGEISPGAVLNLDSKPGLRFGWKTKEVVANEKLVQECVEGPGGSAGKTLSFTLTALGGGTTQVDLADSEWDEGDAGLPFCNTHWGSALHRLKEYVETKKVG